MPSRPRPVLTRPPEPPDSRSDRGYRRLRALARLAIPERPVAVARAVEPCAAHVTRTKRAG